MNSEQNLNLNTKGLKSHIRLVQEASQFKVLYLTSSLDAPFRYRCYNYIEFLRDNGHIANFERVNPLSYLKLEGYNLIILFRVGWNNEVAQIVETAKKLKIPIAFDIDDYIFNPEEINNIRFLKHSSRSEQIRYKIISQNLKLSFEAADYFTGSTSELVELAAQMGKKSFLLPNLINNYLLKYHNIRKKGFSKRLDTPIISYLSGSNTHDEDFEKVSPALLEILEINKNAHLLLIGFLNIDEKFKKFKDRIIRLPFVNWKLLPWIQSLVAVNIAPLAQVDKFSNSKSALKFFEAGAVTVPTVASPSREMEKVIINGENGFIAETKEEWINSINFCLNKNNNQDLGLKAYDSSLNLFSFEAHREEIFNVFNIICKKNDPTSKTRIKNSFISIDQIDLRQEDYSAFEVIKHNIRLLKFILKTGLKNLRQSPLLSMGLRDPFCYTHTIPKTPLVKCFLDPQISIVHHSSDILLDLPNIPSVFSHGIESTKENYFISLNNDPHFRGIFVPGNTVNKSMLFLRMAFRSKEETSYAQIFWLSDKNSIYTEEHSIRFPVICDGKVHTYLVNLTEANNNEHCWNEYTNIYKLRFDPISCTGVFKILEMRFIDQVKSINT